MAMLEWMQKNCPPAVVCHVNYHKRPSAARDEKIVRDYCERCHLPLLVLHPCYTGGNFQDWARRVRYEFFEAAAAAFKADEIYIAHQQDDLIETWLLQKKRKAKCSTYGLQRRTPWKNLTLVRPMLSFTKAQLEQQCKDQNVPFGIDESNLENTYLRNQLRHSVIEKMNEKERAQILEEIRRAQRQQQQDEEQTGRLARQALEKDGSLIFTHPAGSEILERIIFDKTGHHYPAGQLRDWLEKLKNRKSIRIAGPPSFRKTDLPAHDLQDEYRWILEMNNGLLRLDPAFEPIPFYIADAVQLQGMIEHRYVIPGFAVSFAGTGTNIQRMALGESDFPVVIRSFRPGDAIAMRFGTRKISRFLIDRKIPAALRLRWPLVENSDGQIVFVKSLGCAASFFTGNPLFYMLELTLSN